MAEPARKYETTQTDSQGWAQDVTAGVRAAAEEAGVAHVADELAARTVRHLTIPAARRAIAREHYAQQRWEDGYQAALAARGRLRIIRGR